jgi:hypothetical protein
MTKTQKITLGVGAITLTAIIAYVFYRKRWQEFVNIGNSKWLPTDYNDNQLSLEMANENHGIKTGDSIEIEHKGAWGVPDGKAQAVDVVVKAGTPFVITSLKLEANPRLSGKVRVTS